MVDSKVNNIKPSKNKSKKYSKIRKNPVKGGYVHQLMNINKSTLKKCSIKPMTGFYRDGYCRTDYDDLGTHTVCAKMDKPFMEYTKKQGNNLYSVVKPGENWCLCEYRWEQAYRDGYAPKVIAEATNIKTNPKITKKINNTLYISS